MPWVKSSCKVKTTTTHSSAISALYILLLVQMKFDLHDKTIPLTRVLRSSTADLLRVFWEEGSLSAEEMVKSEIILKSEGVIFAWQIDLWWRKRKKSKYTVYLQWNPYRIPQVVPTPHSLSQGQQTLKPGTRKDDAPCPGPWLFYEALWNFWARVYIYNI